MSGEDSVFESGLLEYGDRLRHSMVNIQKTFRINQNKIPKQNLKLKMIFQTVKFPCNSNNANYNNVYLSIFDKGLMID